jgi:hypothetical protein
VNGITDPGQEFLKELSNCVVDRSEAVLELWENQRLLVWIEEAKMNEVSRGKMNEPGESGFFPLGKR